MSPFRFGVSSLLALAVITGVELRAAWAQAPQAMPVSTAWPQTTSTLYAAPPTPTVSSGPLLAAAYDPLAVNANSAPVSAGLVAADGAAPLAANGDVEAATAIRRLQPNDYVERVLTGEESWTWQLLPTGLMYKTYLASPTEPRLASTWGYSDEQGWVWNATLGARVGIVRYGTQNDFWPQGWQLDVEGAAFPRLDDIGNVVGNDYIFGVPLTTRQGPWEWKLGYRHYCSHIADEYLLLHPGFHRINYVRDSILSGVALYLNPNLRIYAEAGWGFWCDDGAKPWEFQFGLDFSPPGPTTVWGAPFFAINSHLSQETDFSGNLTVETGWQWRGQTGHLFRIGMHYFNGLSEQRQFYNQWEEEIGFGAWYDF